MNNIKSITLFFISYLLSLNATSQIGNGNNDTLHQKSLEDLEALFFTTLPDTLKALQYSDAYFKKLALKKDTLATLEAKFLFSQVMKNDSIFLNYCDSLIIATSKTPTKKHPTSFFLDKNRFFYHTGNFKKALEELSNANTYLKKYKNDSIQHIYYVRMGLLKGYFGQPKEAIELYKKAYKYALENNLLNSGDFTSILPNIASNFSRLHMPDSAFKYNNIAIKRLTTTPKTLQVQHLLEGKIFWDQHAYQKSLDSYLKAMNYFSDENNFWLITNTYTKIGINYDSLKNSEKATKFHLKADSVYTLYNASSSYIKYSFQYLISYYKDLNNIKKQLEYTNKLLEVQKMNLEEEGQIQETFTNEFDIPNLLAERKKIIEQLDASSKRGNLIYSSLLIISIVVIMYLIRKKRSYKKRFSALVNKEHIVVNEPAKKNDTIEKSLISEEIVSEILTHLANFEKTLGFIDSSLNLKNLANQFNTNANYLSKVINQHKHTTFSNYINQLRIDYAVQQLKLNPLWRKYTVKAIASEVGFNNAESFSKAFYKYTELKPSYFIKELEKSDVKLT